ncbi:GbsR/MarR family transcriptional regulator [Spongisporangium articulatum]|uniref:GbsR/MarR family transcriptional regulator n=1 Tax=Spongisporangium articulatum TaxID=3362603 RepID=A0ABW8AJ69_9ACTN
MTPDGDEAAVRRFVEQFAENLVAAGMPRMPSRVFACLLVSPQGRLTAAELAESLQVSPAAVSGAVRYLIQVDLAARERLPGSRREVYRLYANAWYEMMASRDQMLARWVTTLGEGIEVLGADSPGGRRLVETRAFMQFLEEELEGLLERWRARNP